MIISVTNCPVAEVPAPPAVSVVTPAEVIVPANVPATPPDIVKVSPYDGISATTPAVTSTPAPIAAIASPWVNVSVNVKAEPAVLTSYVPTSKVGAAVALPAVRAPKCPLLDVSTLILDPETE